MINQVLPRSCRGVCVKRLTNCAGARGGEPRYNAFTLIELVLVVGIIAVLAGLVLSTVGYARKKGALARAETEIAAISAACENYKADNAVYPNSSGTGGTNGLDPSTTNLANYEMPCRYMYGEISGDRDFDGTPDTNARPYMAFKEVSLLRADMSNPPSSSNPVTAIRDPFGNSYGYSTMKASGGVNGYNPTFDLWSIADGAAGTDQTKWIKNW
jgi:prepilin-type N-terminal cleavage/methylation domain-containing protein